MSILRALLISALFLSGFASLGYQLVLTRLFGIAIGHEFATVLAIVCAYFLGMSIGAWLLNRVSARHHNPIALFAYIEAGIAIWMLLLAAALPSLIIFFRTTVGTDLAPSLHWMIIFAFVATTLLPATALMGASILPVERALFESEQHRSQIGLSFGVNTAGAVLGVLAATFWLMPAAGHSQTLILLCMGSATAAALAFSATRFVLPTTTRSIDSGSRQPNSKASGSHSHANLLLMLFVAGLLGIGYEVVMVRAIGQILEGTVYTFAAALAVFLTGSAIGSIVAQHSSRRLSPLFSTGAAATGLTISIVIGAALLSLVPTLYRYLRGILGDHLFGVLGAELAIASLVFLAPTFLMGFLLTRLLDHYKSIKSSFGTGLAINTLGATTAPIILGVVLTPLFGTKWALLFIAIGYAALAVQLSELSRFSRVLLLLPSLVGAALLPNLHLTTLRQGEQLIHVEQGVTATLAIVDRNGARNLRINNRFQMGGTHPQALRIQRMQAHIPLLLHQAPKDVLFLGVATGITMGTALEHRPRRVVGVELVPETISNLEFFSAFNRIADWSPSVTTVTADARRFVHVDDSKYDVVIADLFHPGRDGGGLLYTLDHFEAIRDRLAPNGLFCQWVPLYQVSESMLRDIVATLNQVFPNIETYVASFDLNFPALGLVASMAPRPPLDLARLEMRIASLARLRQQLKQAGVVNGVEFLLHRLSQDPAIMDRFGATGRVNTDDRPRLLYEAPIHNYLRKRRPFDTLERFLAQLPESTGTEHPSRSEARLAAAQQARDAYYTGMMLQVHQGDEAAIKQLIRAASLSPDFPLAYAQVIQFALSKKVDLETRLDWLQALTRARPEQPFAQKLIEKLRRENAG